MCVICCFQINKVLQAFHSALQNFSVTFEELKKFNRTDIYPEGIAPIRSRIVEGMAQLLIQVNNDQIQNIIRRLSIRNVYIMKNFMYSHGNWCFDSASDYYDDTNPLNLKS